MVAQARYVPDEKSVFLIRRLGLFNVFTLPGRGTERGEETRAANEKVLPSRQYVYRCSVSRSDSGLPHATLLASFMSLAYGRGGFLTRKQEELGDWDLAGDGR
jgi:hypothetical protein